MIVIQCDEHVKRSIIEGLCAKGLDAWGVEQEQLKGLSDHKLLTFCLEKNRVLLTNDKDFFALAQSTAHAGIVFITDQHAATGDIVRAVLYLVFSVKEGEFRNSIFYVP